MLFYVILIQAAVKWGEPSPPTLDCSLLHLSAAFFTKDNVLDCTFSHKTRQPQALEAGVK